MRKILGVLLMLGIGFATNAQDSFTENFDDNTLTGWYGGTYYTLTEENQSLTVAAVTTSGSYRVFSRSFTALDLSTYPFIKVDIKSANTFNLRIDFVDTDGKITNGQSFSVAITGDNAWHTYTLNYTGRFTQSWPAASTVNPASIDEVSIFVNPGGTAFNNTFYMDNLLIGSATGITPPPAGIRHNQIGFYPNMEKKIVVVDAPASDFYVVSQDKQDTLYTGTLGNAASWAASGETARIANFSSFTTPGNYFLLIPNIGYSHPFKIEESIHFSLAKASLRSFYFQRCSSPITVTNGAPWNRALGHPDNQVSVHNSAASTLRPTGTKINGAGGWYDAGDFNKYVINSGISTHEMLATYEFYKDVLDTMNLNIPESGNAVPDILDEIKWQMKWLLTMQDPWDGGVYFKLTTPNFDGIIMPSASNQTRYVIKKTTAAALDFAAVCAQAARVYKPYEAQFPGFADSCINAAVKAWKWARKNPSIQYIQSQMTNPAINTGAYGDANFNDEFHWAAIELYITTKVDSFYTLSGSIPTVNVPGWASVSSLGNVSLVLHRKHLTSIADTTTFKSRLQSAANNLRNRTTTSAYNIVMNDNDFYWGSNGIACNQALILLTAFDAFKDSTYLRAALANLDYVLGRNATNFCFVTGFGNVSPMNIHHSASGADGVLNPVPGLIAGGPNTDAPNDCGAASYPSSTLKAKSYADAYCSYSTNEVAINWNAPLSFITIGIESILKGVKSKPVNVQVTPTDIATIEEVTSVATPQELNKLVSLFPNPSNGEFTLENIQFIDDVKIINSLGTEVKSIGSLAAGSHTIEAREITPGLYFIVLEKDGISSTKKLMIE